MSVPESERLRHTSFWVPLCDRPVLRRPEDLPISFEAKPVRVQPFFNSKVQLPQFALAAREHGDVVHVANVVLDLEAALTYQVVEWLKRRVREPLRRVRADLDTVFDDPPNEIQHTRVFDKLAHTCHDDLRLQAWVEVIDVAL